MWTQNMNGALRWRPGLKALARPAAWTCVAAIAALSLTPSDAVVRTGLGGHVEHTVAYAGTTFLAAAAYGGWMRVAASMLAYAGALELLQHFSPGRTPSLVDYMFSAAGTVIGAAGLALLLCARNAWART
jgi:hypothetical protein